MTDTTATLTKPILNVAAYRFVKLDNLEALREQLKSHAEQNEILGTILLSAEGINLFLAGEESNVRTFMDTLRTFPQFEGLETKDSYCEEQPFRRMLVRLKKEIIAFGIDGIEPQRRTSPKLPAKELKRWLDEGKKVRLLDVRNDYEFDLGTFRGAEVLDLQHFRDFPKAIEQLPEEAKDEPIVMFCTGGIRCEKAGPLMEQAGYKDIYQLEGGILKYFEEVGGEHYDGSCFVFDNRVALDPELKPTGNLLCFTCQAVLTSDDVQSEQYRFGEYCPHCYEDPEQKKQREFEARQTAARELAASQPGCQPYNNVRHIFVPAKMAGLTLIEFLCKRNPGIDRQQWMDWLNAGDICHVSSNWQHRSTVTPDKIVKEGECFEQSEPATTEPPIAHDISILHEDDSLLIVEKPAPMPCHPSGRFNRNTLTWILGEVYQNDKLRIAHRLDANTSGVTILCRKHRASKMMHHAFRQQQVAKKYLAKVEGHVEWETQVCELPISPEAGPQGSRCVTQTGLPARTEFRVLERHADGTSLVEAQPITGRTHQIRLHLQQLGYPIVGDPVYGAEASRESVATLAVDASPMCLHCVEITFPHPDTLKPVSFQTELPTWAQQSS